MSQGLQHEYLLQHAPQWAAGEEPAPPHSYAWGISRASCFSHSSLSELLCVIFNSINNYKFCNKHDITEMPTTSVADCLSFGQLWVCFGASWCLLCPTPGQILFFSHKDHSWNLPAPNTLPWKPNTDHLFWPQPLKLRGATKVIPGKFMKTIRIAKNFNSLHKK